MPETATQPRPSEPQVMWQRWTDLLFLHWSWEACEVQKTLPPGLEVDCWDGRAWLGFVPFFMRRVRPVGLPAVPLLSDFLELNVRTYVRDREGRPGVWFYSLDCNQPVAVRVARAGFSLPYFDAAMSASKTGRRIDYLCRRAGFSETCAVGWNVAGAARRAQAGSFEEFLVERYRLFAARKNTLLTGRVWHHPYDIAPVTFSGSARVPLRQAGFDVGSRPPEHAVASPGVDVRVFLPSVVRGG